MGEWGSKDTAYVAIRKNCCSFNLPTIASVALLGNQAITETITPSFPEEERARLTFSQHGSVCALCPMESKQEGELL